jgi:hypothetical protein
MMRSLGASLDVWVVWVEELEVETQAEVDQVVGQGSSTSTSR